MYSSSFLISKQWTAVVADKKTELDGHGPLRWAGHDRGGAGGRILHGRCWWPASMLLSVSGICELAVNEEMRDGCQRGDSKVGRPTMPSMRPWHLRIPRQSGWTEPRHPAHPVVEQAEEERHDSVGDLLSVVGVNVDERWRPRSASTL